MTLNLSEVRRLHEQWIERADAEHDPGFPGASDGNLYFADDRKLWRLIDAASRGEASAER